MLTEDNSFRVLEIFFKSPERKTHIREIARLAKLSPPGVMKIIKKLESGGLVISEKEGFVKNIRASKSDKFIQLKRFYNLYSLYDCDLVQFLRKHYEEPEAIILFGSYSRGEDISKSDIDIVVITSINLQLDLKKFEAILARKIDLREVKIKNAEKGFLNNLSNGIVLYGYLKVLQ